jgi:MFS family permease
MMSATANRCPPVLRMTSSASLQPLRPADSRWPQRRLVLLLMAVCFLGHFNRISMATAADLRIMPEYGISTSAMGTIYSAFLLAYTVFMIPGGWLIDRRGPRLALGVVCLGSAVFVALTASVVLAASATVVLAMLLVIRSLMGMLSTPLHPASATAVSQNLPAVGRSGANGWITGAALLGIASTHVVFGKLIDWFDWPGAFLLMALVTAALGLLWMVYGPARTAAAELTREVSTTPSPDEPASGTIRYKNLILLTLSYGAVGYFQYLFFYWVHHYFSDVLKVGEDRSRFYAGIPTLAMAVGMPLGGLLSDRLFARFGWRVARSGLVATAMTASAVLLWFGASAREPVWSITWLSLSFGVMGMAEGPFWVTAVEVGGKRGGLSAAIFNTGGNGIGLIAPIATPFISDDLGFGWQAGISVASIVCLAGAACWIWIGPDSQDSSAFEERRPNPAPYQSPQAT